MGDLIIRNLDEAILVELKRKAWHQGLPLQMYLRRLLIASIEDESEPVERALFFGPPSGAGRRESAPYSRLHI